MESIERTVAAAEAADGAAPLDEATLLTLRHHPDRVRSWVRDDGFALLIGSELSLVVHPDARGKGLGGALLAEALPTSGEVLAWSHGNHPAAATLARSHGFERVRELWVMRRPTSLPLPDRAGSAAIRGYRDSDADELVRVNAAAFAHHPEQAAMDLENVAERMSQDWFDPAGLLVASDGDRMLGFHWTKQHSPDLGEVYVVGIDPAAQGRGLGKELVVAGLEHLAARGVRAVLLYVESDNDPAVRLYSKLGFGHAEADTHVMYRRR